jgi:hypothetical protein
MIGYKEDSMVLKPADKPTELPPEYVHTRIRVSITYFTFKYVVTLKELTFSLGIRLNKEKETMIEARLKQQTADVRLFPKSTSIGIRLMGFEVQDHVTIPGQRLPFLAPHKQKLLKLGVCLHFDLLPNSCRTMHQSRC